MTATSNPDFSDASCSFAPPAKVAFRDGKLVALRLRGKLGPRSRAAVLGLEALEYLDIRQLTGINNAWLGKLGELPALRVLDAWRTSLADGGAAGLASSTSLEAIDVRATKLTDDGLAALAALPSLRYAQCSAGRRVPDSGLRQLAMAPRLELLAVVRPPMTFQSHWIHRDSVAAIAAGARLRVLSLFGVVNDESGIEALQRLPGLEELCLGSNYHQGARRWMRSLEGLERVRLLDLSFCMFRDLADLSPLATMPALEAVNLYGIALRDQTPVSLELDSIRSVVVRSSEPAWVRGTFPKAHFESASSTIGLLGVEGKVRLPSGLDHCEAELGLDQAKEDALRSEST